MKSRLILHLCALAGALLSFNACSSAGTVPAGSSPTVQGGQSLETLDKRATRVTLPAGVRLNPVSYAQARRIAAWAQSHPLRIGRPYRQNGSGPYLWVSDSRGAVWQTLATNSPATTGKKIVGALYDCIDPTDLKVDGRGNLWVVCAGTTSVNMYAPKAVKATLVLQEARAIGSQHTYPFPSDVAIDNDGNVYVVNGFTVLFGVQKGLPVSIGDVQVFHAKAACGGLPCNNALPDAILIDPRINNLSCPSGSGPYRGCNDVTGYASFIDVNKRGTVYLDFDVVASRCYKNGTCSVADTAIGVDAIRGAAGKSPKFVRLLRGLTAPRGLYLTSNDTVLNVLEGTTDVITRYAVSRGGSPGWLGPIAHSPLTDCYPFGIGFNQSESLVAASEIQCDSVSVGDVSTNQFTAQPTWGFGPLAGAAFEPSDK